MFWDTRTVHIVAATTGRNSKSSGSFLLLTSATTFFYTAVSPETCSWTKFSQWWLIRWPFLVTCDTRKTFCMIRHIELGWQKCHELMALIVYLFIYLLLIFSLLYIVITVQTDHKFKSNRDFLEYIFPYSSWLVTFSSTEREQWVKEGNAHAV